MAETLKLEPARPAAAGTLSATIELQTLGDGDPEEGELVARLAGALAPHYELRSKLGSGGFGSVFRAVHRNTGQEVAVKALRPQGGRSAHEAAARIARFEREAELCAGLRHPNIVRLLDRSAQGPGGGGERAPDELCYAIYELVPGETLRDLLERERQLPVDRAAELMGQVLDALATAHAKGVVHRDLKPSNIMVVSTGLTEHVKVLDFGVSTLTLEARDTAFLNVTRSREMVGTPRYSAPEQLRGDVPTTKTDLYAWGLVFLECVTGRKPISGSTLAEIYQQHLSPIEIPLPDVMVGHPLGDFLRRVLRKDPAKRAGDAGALYAEFRALPLGALVGALQGGRGTPESYGDDTVTFVSEARLQRRQVTAIALALRLVPAGERAAEADAFDPILQDQLNLCRDALTRYGGTVTGQLGDQIVAMFGYPSASDTDARRAVRTVLELAEGVRERGARLAGAHGLALELRVGIHTGPVTAIAGEAPVGMTPTRALSLAAAAPPNAMIVSAESRRLLDPFAEFEAGEPVAVNGHARPVPTARLLGERRGEALSFKPGQAGAPELIGRRAELAELGRLAAARRRGATLALVVGEAGVGKSRLVREFLLGERARGRAVHECRCLAEQRNNALSPILPILERRLGLDRADPRRASELLVELLAGHGLDPGRFASIVCTWLSLPLPQGFAPASMAPYRQRELLLEALVAILCRLGDAEPAAVLVEDLHWADPTTLDLLGKLLEAEFEGAPLLVCTARPEFEPPWPGPAVAVLSLDRLPREAAEELAKQAWGGPEGPPLEVLKAIVERADGIPLFVEELARMLAEQKAGGSSGLGSIPITLRDSLAGRLDRLGGASVAVARVAAALGREFDGAILFATANADEATVRDALERLTQAKLLYRRRRVDGSSYVFRHALLQDAAYDSMPADVRRQTHARLAEALERQFPGSPHSSAAELARHHAGAGAFEAAVRHGAAAAQASLDRSNNAEAMAQAAQVAAWLPELPGGARVDAELRLNGIVLQALMSTRGWASSEVRELAEASRALLPASREKEHTVSTLFGLYMHYHVASDRAQCRRVADELVEFAERIDDGALRSVAATAKGVNFHAEGRFLDAEVWLERARAHYDPARDRLQGSVFGMDCRVWATAQLAQVQWGMGRTARAFALAHEAIEWARAIQHVPSLGIGLLYISQIYQLAGDRAAVRQSTGELLEAAKTYGLPAFEGYAATIASWAAGDLEGVAAIIGVLKSLNCNLILTYYGSFLADIEADAGNVREAIGHVEAFLAMGAAQGEHVFEAELCRRRALYELRLPEPDLDVVRGALDRARRLAREQGMYRFEAAAIREYQRAFGESEELSDRLARIHDLVPDLQDGRVIP
ncbi:MAG TPA: TOMM system kinase/cyclase fusion protein [Polyangiaceae bacterium]|nr:TOMM system kinase/cyclase fusion protein [Polyangiaceae bacterium]